MVPLAKHNSTSNARNIYRDGSMITDSWFIGAFGKWWRGGMIEAWYQDIVARSKDEESWTSGILTVKALDKYNEYNGGLNHRSVDISARLTNRSRRSSFFHKERVARTGLSSQIEES
jgi:hypothetical protein